MELERRCLGQPTSCACFDDPLSAGIVEVPELKEDPVQSCCVASAARVGKLRDAAWAQERAGTADIRRAKTSVIQQATAKWWIASGASKSRQC